MLDRETMVKLVGQRVDVVHSTTGTPIGGRGGAVVVGVVDRPSVILEVDGERVTFAIDSLMWVRRRDA